MTKHFVQRNSGRKCENVQKKRTHFLKLKLSHFIRTFYEKISFSYKHCLGQRSSYFAFNINSSLRNKLLVNFQFYVTKTIKTHFVSIIKWSFTVIKTCQSVFPQSLFFNWVYRYSQPEAYTGMNTQLDISEVCLHLAIRNVITKLIND